MEQTEASGQLLGYRLMHLKCIQHGFVLKRETVRLLLSILDPIGVMHRSEELNTVARLWNTHRIRAQRNSTAPQGRPLMMYTVPHLYGFEDHLCPCTMENIVNCEEECRTRRNYSCDKTVFELCCLLMDEHRLDPPDNTEQATDLYITLRQEIRDLL
ncbi:UNVERIFIED_CONTAM: hypothetical protein FKN15_078329 [Acipenser sinensis]